MLWMFCNVWLGYGENSGEGRKNLVYKGPKEGYAPKEGYTPMENTFSRKPFGLVYDPAVYR
jgi:hypothetical protein